MSVTEFQGTDGATRANFNARIQEANKHISDQTVHTTTLTCTKSGTVYALTGLTATSGKVPVMFSVPTAYASGDTVTIDGTAYTLKTRDNSALTAGAWAAGAIITGTVDVDAKTLTVAPSAPVGAMPTKLVDVSGAITDFCQLVSPGRYRIMNATANCPPGYTSGNNDFIIHVDNPVSVPTNGYVDQTVYDIRSLAIWNHKCINGTWTWAEYLTKSNSAPVVISSSAPPDTTALWAW